ncbi:hypothetical protein FAF44_49610 [Nonomuraea sp. MG754425]|nr:hypothetical protein [Nonomuraea sp. MG754425]
MPTRWALSGLFPASVLIASRKQCSQRALCELIITAWKAAHRSVSGHQGKYEMREIVNALLYHGVTMAPPRRSMLSNQPLRSPSKPGRFTPR